jgi:hypothetical protein
MIVLKIPIIRAGSALKKRIAYWYVRRGGGNVPMTAASSFL